MKRWIGPVIVALIAAAIAYGVALNRTPQFLMSAAVKRVGKLGMNRFTHTPLATSASRAIVRPSPDLAYSSCPFDLSARPLAITVQPVPAPYWSLSVFDANTDVAFVRNNTETRGQPIRVVVAREGQPVPAGSEVVRAHGTRGIALIRILVDDRGAFPAIDRARRASSCAPVG